MSRTICESCSGVARFIFQSIRDWASWKYSAVDNGGVIDGDVALHQACERLIVGPDYFAEPGANVRFSSGESVELVPEVAERARSSGAFAMFLEPIWRTSATSSSAG